MGPTEINGLPAHALLVHVVVVLVPLAALLVVASVTWPAARRRLGLATPVVALIALVSVPLTTHAGEWLQARVAPSPLVARHVELGDSLLPWSAAVFILAAASWWIAQRATAGSAAHSATQSSTGPRALVVAVAVLSVVAAVGSVVQIYRIGDSGAKAVWHNQVSSVPHPVPGN